MGNASLPGLLRNEVIETYADLQVKHYILDI